MKLNQQTVRNWIDQGSLPAVKVGRRVRIKRSDLDRLVEQGYRSVGPGTPAAGPNAHDFWSGEPVGVAEVNPAAAGFDAAIEPPGRDSQTAEPAGQDDASARAEPADGHPSAGAYADGGPPAGDGAGAAAGEATGPR